MKRLSISVECDRFIVRREKPTEFYGQHLSDGR